MRRWSYGNWWTAALSHPRTDNYFRPGEYEACIDRSLQRWNPAYWRARQKRLSVQAAKATKERER